MFKVNKKKKIESMIKDYKKMIYEYKNYIRDHNPKIDKPFTMNYCKLLYKISSHILYLMDYINDLDLSSRVDFEFDVYRIGHINNLIHENPISEPWKELVDAYDKYENILTDRSYTKLYDILEDLNSYLLEDKRHFELYNSYEYPNNKYIFDNKETDIKYCSHMRELYFKHAKKIVESGIEPYATSLKEIVYTDIDVIKGLQQMVSIKLKEKEKSVTHLMDEIEELIRKSSFFGFYVRIV